MLRTRRPSSNSIRIAVNSNLVVPSVLVVASTTTICSGTNVSFTATPVNGGTSPMYQWKRNGQNTGNNSDSYNSNSLVNGDIISVLMTSNAPCAVPSTAASNQITMIVNALSGDPQISITGESNVIEGQATLVLTNTTNAGTNPSFEWQDSTSGNGWQSIAGALGSTLNYKPLVSGDKIRCIISSDAVCLNEPRDTSNTLTFTVNKVTAIDPVPGSQYNIRLYPNPAISSLTIDTLKISDRWYALEIVTSSGMQVYLSKDILNQSIVTVDVSSLPNGLYFVVLRRKSGESAYLKFIKQR